MCFSLPLRFILSQQKELNQKLKSIFFKKNLKEKIIKLKYLLRWVKGDKINFQIEKNINNYNKENNNNLLDDSGSIFEDFMLENKKIANKNNIKNNKKNNFSNKKNEKIVIKNNTSFNKSRSNKKYFYNKVKDLLTTSDRMELLQLSECTFKPSINTTNNSLRNTKANSKKKLAFIKLYQDNEKYKIKKRLKELEFEKRKNNELTFKPHLFTTPKSISTFKFDSFEERQKKFINNKKENTNKLKTNIERNTARKCSFTPKINKIILDFNLSTVGNNRNNFTNVNITSSNQAYDLTSEENKQNININSKNISKNNNINYIEESYYSLTTAKTVPAHLRLYNDSQRRNSSYIKRENDYKKLIDDMANRTSKKFVKVNYDKLFDLYENKGGKAITEKTKQKVEKEEGTTFKPELCSNSNKYINRICNNFYERNKNNKKNNTFKKYENFDEKYKKKEKKFTDEQKKRIINNIVERLYKEPLDKKGLKNINKTECDKYLKNYGFVDTSRYNVKNKKSEIN